MTALTKTSHGIRRSEPEAEARQYLTFTLGEDVYGVAIGKVREIVEFHTLTQIPLMPGFLRGVTNLRGAVIPVVDLLSRFGHGLTEIGRRTCIVIVEVDIGDDKSPLGIIVNAVNEVVPVDPSKIESRPAFGSKIRADFVEALLNLGERFVIALDVQQTLSVDEMSEIAARWVDKAESWPEGTLEQQEALKGGRL